MLVSVIYRVMFLIASLSNEVQYAGKLQKGKKNPNHCVFTQFLWRLAFEGFVCLYPLSKIKLNSQIHVVENVIMNLRVIGIAYRILPSLKAELCPMKTRETPF